MAGAKIFRYVVRYDGGTAPRPFDGVCSLAICKPRIRAKAQVGDWVIGFRSRHPGEVLYAMQVTERLKLGDYWDDPRFYDRKPGASPYPDNFYRRTPDGSLVQVPNAVHVPEDTAKDTSGLYVLLSSRFWYFGKNSVPLPNHLVHLVHTSQGHATDIRRQPNDVRHLQEWLESWPVGQLGKPLDDRGDLKPAESRNVAPERVAVTAPIRNATPKPSRSCSAGSRRSKSTGPRRTIFSRKGFDSSYGGMPSPILPDGRMLALPIPAAHDSWTLADVRADDLDLQSLIQDLSQGKHSLATRVHLDPDLDRLPDKRMAGWRPSLGQTGAAQTHLERCGVGHGDIFLFFGWFRQVERRDGRWQYVRSAPNLHVLSGWLEVAEVLRVVAERDKCLQAHPWIADHPHVQNPAHYTDLNNTLYIAPAESSHFPAAPGGGFFSQFRPELQLTLPGHSRSVWGLPHWMEPRRGREPLSYHGDSKRWSRSQEVCMLQTVAKGQEFVLNAEQYPESLPWLRSLLDRSAGVQENSRQGAQG